VSLPFFFSSPLHRTPLTSLTPFPLYANFCSGAELSSNKAWSLSGRASGFELKGRSFFHLDVARLSLTYRPFYLSIIRCQPRDGWIACGETLEEESWVVDASSSFTFPSFFFLDILYVHRAERLGFSTFSFPGLFRPPLSPSNEKDLRALEETGVALSSRNFEERESLLHEIKQN